MNTKLLALFGLNDQERLVGGMAVRITKVIEPHGHATTVIESLSTMNGEETLYIMVRPFYFHDKIVTVLRYDGKKLYAQTGEDFQEVTLEVV